MARQGEAPAPRRAGAFARQAFGVPNGSMRNIPRPPYATLVDAYSMLLAGQHDAGDAMDCPATAGGQQISMVQ